MKNPKNLYLFTIVGGMLIVSGCYSLVFKPQDMKNLRRQLHLPTSVRFIAFDSNPKQAGFFGREGLHISGTIEFSEDELRKYMSELNDAEIWNPVSYLSYSPSIGDRYSSNAFLWKDLPLPIYLEHKLGLSEGQKESLNVQSGMYYCSVLVPERGEPLESNPAVYRWKYIGKTCSELSESEFPVILTFAVLDMNNQIMYAYISFSG